MAAPEIISKSWKSLRRMTSVEEHNIHHSYLNLFVQIRRYILRSQGADILFPDWPGDDLWFFSGTLSL
jgi:hypothetical protein